MPCAQEVADVAQLMTEVAEFLMAECFDADADADETVDIAKMSFGFVLMSAPDSGAFGVFDVEAGVVGPDHVGKCFDGVAFYAVA